MVSEDDDGPAGKELVIVEIGFRESEIRNEMIGSRPGFRAGFA